MASRQLRRQSWQSQSPFSTHCAKVKILGRSLCISRNSRFEYRSIQWLKLLGFYDFLQELKKYTACILRDLELVGNLDTFLGNLNFEGFWGFGRNIGWFTIKNWDTNQSITINGLVSMDLFWRNYDFLRGNTSLYHSISYMVTSIVQSICWRIYTICPDILYVRIDCVVHVLKDLCYLFNKSFWVHTSVILSLCVSLGDPIPTVSHSRHWYKDLSIAVNAS